ncbi:hypothetical protein [Cellulomonas biazotea]|uniref:Uncharacterized protein n=1 Tax=Cellulomonas biazotea TaxID=1709 RepID=A0A402DTU6_9CELL|nr:hypothetical protein [Cellulomonas biazotea]GCE77553.1 hypothetical protein CBZ_26090 [Cellulomonas biazotea]
MTGTAAPTRTAAPQHLVRRRWASIVGIAFAALLTADLTHGTDVAPVLTAAAVVYLGAAALRSRRTAWPLFFVTIVVVAAARLLGFDADPTWVLLGLGAVLAVVGLVRGALRPAYGLPLQGLALLVFGAVAALAPAATHDVGAYLLAAGLLAHAGWDVHHHRTQRVVPRSLAEFCVVLDVLLAAVIVAVTALA